MSNKTLISLLLLLSLLSLSTSKTVRKTFTVRNFESAENKWNYLTKFAMDFGLGGAMVRARLINVPQDAKERLGDSVAILNLNIVLDDGYESYQNSRICDDPVQNNALMRNDIQLSANGEWSPDYERYFQQSQKNHIWYFMVNDCNNNLRKVLGAEDNWKIEFEAVIRNSDRSHFSYDQQGFLTSYIVLFLGSLAFLVIKSKQLYKSYSRDEELDYPFFLGLASLLFQTASFFFEIINLSAYQQDGEGILIFQVLMHMASICSQLTITLFLVLVSWGWTLTYKRLKKLEFYAPLVLTLVVIHIVISGLGSVDNDSMSKFHIYDGWSGYLTLLLRLAIFAYYIFGIQNTKQVASEKIREFIDKFTIFGGFYFLAFPILVLVSNVCDQYIRNQIIIIGGLLLQTVFISSIIYLNSSQNSIYYKASQKSSALLPNGKDD